MLIKQLGILDFYFSAMDYGSGYEYAGPFINAMIVEQDSTFELGTHFDILPRENQIHMFENYPNPFNPSTTFSYSVTQPGKTELVLYSVTGQLVSQIITRYSPAGEHQVVWSADELPSGLFIAKLNHNSEIKIKKILIVK